MLNKDYEKAGEIAKQAREFARNLIKENSSYLEIVEKIENKIIELGGKPAFPVNICVNNLAAHDIPLMNDERKLKKGDLVKIDIGTHFNGCVADTAITIEVNNNQYENLIKASEEALAEAIKIVKPGAQLREIGKVIQDTITKYGYSPIRNLSGHEIKEYTVHAGLTVPNYDNNDKHVLEKDMIIAIEPFATTGEGMIKEGKLSGIYVLINKKNTRNLEARKVLDFIDKEYKTLPFCARWLKFNNINFILRLLENDGIIKQYNQLPERSNGIVSQAEHTIIVGKGVLT
jgi:methionyl aminopeptidase